MKTISVEKAIARIVKTMRSYERRFKNKISYEDLAQWVAEDLRKSA